MSYRPKIKKTVSGVVTKVDLPLDAETIKGLDIIENNKIKSSLLPAIAITDTYVVNTEQAMLALQAETGDVAIRTDARKTYILTTNDPSVTTNWKELLSPGTVVSVNGQTGTVELTYSDVGACANNDSRLSDARPASDVPDWAKKANKPSYTYSEISGVPTDLGDFTNNAGYTKNLGTVTSVNNAQPDANGNVTIVIPEDSVTSVNGKTGIVQLTYSDVGAQAPINDLDTIRSNASAGASKVSANNNTITIKKNGVKIDDFTLNQSTDKDINITVPAEVTESTVTSWGFTKNVGTVTKVNNTSPDSNGNITIAIPAEVTETTVSNWGFIYEDDISTYLDDNYSMGASDFAAWQHDIDDTAGHAYTKPPGGIPASDLAETYLKTTDISAWAKEATKPSYTASEVGAYPDTNPNGYTSNVGTVTKVNNTSPDANGNVAIAIPAEVTENTVTGWGFTKNVGTVTKVQIGTGGGPITPDNTGKITLPAIYTQDDVDSLFQPKLVSGTNIKTINSTSLLGSGNIDIPVVTESTVSGWGFTKTKGTVKSVNNSFPDSNGNVNIEATTTVITMVDTLPVAANVNSNMIYSVPKSSGAVSGDNRDEYYSAPGSTITTEGVSGITSSIHALDEDYEYVGTLTVGNVTDIQISLDGISVARCPHSYSYTYSNGVIRYVMGSVMPERLVMMNILYKANVWEKIGSGTEVTENTVSGWGFTKNAGTVTSVRVQAGTGLVSSTNTAQTSTLNTTISIADGYKLPTTTEWNSKANYSDIGNGRITIRRNSNDSGTYFNLNSSVDRTIDLNIPETGQYYPYRLTLRRNNGEGTGEIAMQLLLANGIGSYQRGESIIAIEALRELEALGPYIRDVVERAWHYDTNSSEYVVDYENLAFVVYDTGSDPEYIYLWFFNQGTIVNNTNYRINDIVDYDDSDSDKYHFVLE